MESVSPYLRCIMPKANLYSMVALAYVSVRFKSMPVIRLYLNYFYSVHLTGATEQKCDSNFLCIQKEELPGQILASLVC